MRAATRLSKWRFFIILDNLTLIKNYDRALFYREWSVRVCARQTWALEDWVQVSHFLPPIQRLFLQRLQIIDKTIRWNESELIKCFDSCEKKKFLYNIFDIFRLKRFIEKCLKPCFKYGGVSELAQEADLESVVWRFKSSRPYQIYNDKII